MNSAGFWTGAVTGTATAIISAALGAPIVGMTFTLAIFMWAGFFLIPQERRPTRLESDEKPVVHLVEQHNHAYVVLVDSQGIIRHVERRR